MSEERRRLFENLRRIPETDLFARMLLVGKIKALDRAAHNPQGDDNG